MSPAPTEPVSPVVVGPAARSQAPPPEEPPRIMVEGVNILEECDEEALKATLDMLRRCDQRDREVLEHIQRLKDVAFAGKSKAEKLRGLLQAQKSRRETAERFMLYWRPVKGGWPLDAVYCGDENGKLKVLYPTDSRDSEKYVEVVEEWEEDYVPLEERPENERAWKKRTYVCQVHQCAQTDPCVRQVPNDP